MKIIANFTLRYYSFDYAFIQLRVKKVADGNGINNKQRKQHDD